MKSLVVVLTVLMVLILGGCSSTAHLNPPANNPFHPPIKEVYISALFTSDEVEQIERSLAVISCDTEYKLIEYHVHLNSRQADYRTINPSTSLIIEKVLSSDPRIIRSDQWMNNHIKNSMTVGLFLPETTTPIILLVEDRIGGDSTLLFKVAMHELGHSLGMDHSGSNTHSIMYHGSNQSADTLTPDDLNTLRLLYGFRSTDFHICT